MARLSRPAVAADLRGDGPHLWTETSTPQPELGTGTSTRTVLVHTSHIFFDRLGRGGTKNRGRTRPAVTVDAAAALALALTPAASHPVDWLVHRCL